MERRTLRRAIALVIVLAIAGGGAAFAFRARGRSSQATHTASASGDTAPGTVERVVPEGTRIRVEVVNATRTRGLARKTAFYLRDLGFDVVDFRTSAKQQDSTVVLDRSGHPKWAELASKQLGGARVESRPDSSRYLDLTIVLGATWRPPPEPFYP